MRISPGLRLVLSRVLLLLLGSSFAASFPFRTLPQRLAYLPRSVSSSHGGQVDRSGFWFDPRYADFLEAVRESTPEKATVAVIAPTTVDLYLYEAAYWLAPRRVVGDREKGQAAFVAVYGSRSPAKGSVGEPITGGTLLRR